jgi:hypothetical protein
LFSPSTDTVGMTVGCCCLVLEAGRLRIGVRYDAINIPRIRR